MHDQFASRFYRTERWNRCRKAYRNAKGGLCERCLARGLIVPGVEVHHRIHLTPDNLDDPEITLSWDNLELLCKACHQQEHQRSHDIRTDAAGHVRW
jgi:5-methylcytosine-specific restriction endonuclease McrA